MCCGFYTEDLISSSFLWIFCGQSLDWLDLLWCQFHSTIMSHCLRIWPASVDVIDLDVQDLRNSLSCGVDVNVRVFLKLHSCGLTERHNLRLLLRNKCRLSVKIELGFRHWGAACVYSYISRISVSKQHRILHSLGWFILLYQLVSDH